MAIELCVPLALSNVLQNIDVVPAVLLPALVLVQGSELQDPLPDPAHGLAPHHLQRGSEALGESLVSKTVEIQFAHARHAGSHHLCKSLFTEKIINITSEARENCVFKINSLLLIVI